MTILSFVTADDVRSVMGATSDDISDAVVGQSVMRWRVEAKLRKVDQGLPETLVTLKALDSSAMTDAQRAQHAWGGVLAVYLYAEALVPTLPLAAVTTDKDLDASVTRTFTAKSVDTLLLNIQGAIAEATFEVREALLYVNPAYGGNALPTSGSIGVDPIVGAG